MVLGKNKFEKNDCLKKVKQNLNKQAQTITIFIKPPSLEALKERLTNRETESTESLKMRLDKAENEMKSAPKFQHIVHNNILSKAGAEIEELVTQFIKS